MSNSLDWQDFPAPAKLNLFLHVVGRRSDGYHLLQSVFQLIDLADTISLRVNEGGEIQHLNPLPGVPAESDLTVRAARLLQKETGCSKGVDIRVEKRLPMGGGVGGGSSDAATVMLALNRLWQLNLPRSRLMELGLSLGADVPFFIFGESAFVEGIGEIMTPVATPDVDFVVLHPQVHVSTPQIFSDPDLTRNTPPIKVPHLSSAITQNDLEYVACKNHPEIRENITWLSQYADARMTGSGSCVFASFSSPNEANRVIYDLPKNMTGYVARSLSKHPLHEFAEF
ncbi:4-(cytidine 5'-diphospho)-2-C-methyl-D-erythritol kinase [Iodobacter fluviatilis]|uniref:4-diphosphocytidyl-2-C-methyl-D-erythritol kinase n=1 Tax=Iodobacter fluviatilis TaxID=537 RepID=A0A377SUU6_9NEIS|nr:4-(cytidine 5'-diphospho)-2-C-methyl-D-erythritol kinase [Iodobacter fluviatilis]TCU81653.1 4-diphosphocytidyl-2-C-methyl-D-erythritol kinase [Iodobacter fluviatilis]STR44747.1 4-diphosphocytidyl-2-C-methyl-D-erythritol kinase [Iodobacter fluviatilis]